MTVTVYDQFDNPMEGVGVNAEITEGPHRNWSHEDDVYSGTTGSEGKFVISYLGGNPHHGLSQDTISIQVDGVDGTFTATKTWEFGEPASIELTHADETTASAVNVIYLEPHTVVATVRDGNNNLLKDAEVQFSVDASDSGLERLFLTSDEATTDTDSRAEFEYVAQYPGSDAAYADVISASVNGIPSNELVKVWRNLELTLHHHPEGSENEPNVTFVSEHEVRANLTAPAFDFICVFRTD